MNLRNNLIKVVAEFFYAYFLLGRNEDARRLFLCNPAVLEFFQRSIDGLFGFQGEFVVRLVGIGIHLVENNIDRLITGADILERLLHHLHLLLFLPTTNGNWR